VTADRIPILADPEIASLILNTFQFLRHRQRIELYGYVLLPDHMHALVASEDLSKEMRCLKSWTAKETVKVLQSRGETKILTCLKRARITDRLDQSFQLWRPKFHPKLIHGSNMFHQKLDYIHGNPIKHGLVKDPAAWPYSSYKSLYITGETEGLDVWF